MKLVNHAALCKLVFGIKRFKPALRRLLARVVETAAKEHSQGFPRHSPALAPGAGVHWKAN
jgi:hypothetical protein